MIPHCYPYRYRVGEMIAALRCIVTGGMFESGVEIGCVG